MKWTVDQEAVIQSHHENLLVSAAAGSGKTAVLTERLLSRLTDHEEPADIDRFLLLTFTKAAAAEMKGRIGEKITKRLEEDPTNTHLQRQLTLLGRARITTIHGFCSWVVRNYGAINELDMGFRVADTGEAKLLRKDMITQVLEEAYAEEDPAFKEAFHAFVETYATGKDETPIEALIEKVFDHVMSNPYPEKYIALCRENNRLSSPEDLNTVPWMNMYWEKVDFLVESGQELVEEGYHLLSLPSAPQKYLPIMDSYRDFMADFKACGHDYAALFELVSHFVPAKAAGNVKKTESKEIQAYQEANKKALDDILKTLNENIFPMSDRIAFEHQVKSAGPIEMLLTLVERFMAAFAEGKRRKNIVDFNDLEHFALRILRDEEGNRTSAAREIADGFDEVMIDEYQDSNFVQEAILTAVSHIDDGMDNYFCVGDVKQSIYRFRQARPDLFMEKYRSYAAGIGGRRIDLHQNFRSRPEILDGTNTIFRSIMRREVGDIDYDDDAALEEGNRTVRLLNALGQEDHCIEVDVVDAHISKEDKADMGSDADDFKKNMLEAQIVAKRIKDMVGKYTVEETKDGQVSTRPLTYGDIVILMRSIADWSTVFKKVLESQDIPCIAEQKKGFFSAYEVTLVLNLLSVLDNERQDIPFVSLMTSVVAGFTGQELAQIRGNQPDKKESCFCDAVKAYIENGPDRALAYRLNVFMETLEDYRRRAVYTPIRELIEEILTETGFGVYAASLPGGERREANLRALCEKAAVYEKTSYVGLFNFVRYIRTLEKYEQDPEVASFGGASDAVRIITIHSSKGLEYPVVFVSSMGKNFNKTDLNATVLTDPFYGIASDYVDYDNRVRVTTLKKEAIRHRLKKEAIGEELRVLYVAMTRAKMKLILTGSFDKKDWRKDQEQRRLEEGRLSAAAITDVGCYYDLVLPVVLSHENDETKQFDLREYDKDAFILKAEEELENTRLGIDYLENMDLEQVSDQEMHDIIQERFNYHYPEEGPSDIPMKVSVSYVKQEHMQDEDGVRADQPEKPRSVIPEFKKDEEERQYLWGAELGTAYHDVLYRLDFPSCCDDSGMANYENILHQMDDMLEKGIIDEKVHRSVRIKKLMHFLNSDLGRRAVEGARRDSLKKEQPFSMNVPAVDLNPDWDPDQKVLIQGIIDAYFEEDDGIILYDYKTDRSEETSFYTAHYWIQLDLYRRALEGATGKPVREMWIYAFTPEEAIKLEMKK